MALTAREPFGTALKMLVTTPGFTLFERWWIGLEGSSLLWAQLPSMVASLAGIVAIYAVCRVHRFAVWISLFGAFIVTLSASTSVYASHVKPYDFDFLFTCLILILVHRALQNLGSRTVVLTAAATILGTWWSLSLAPVLVATWVVLGVAAYRRRCAVALVAVAGIISGTSLLAERFVLRSQITPALTSYWNGYFIRTSSPGQFIEDLARTSGRLVSSLTIARGFPGSFALGLPVLVFWVVLVVIGVRRTPMAVMTFGVAVLAEIAQLAPLGTQRTDIYLIPCLVLLIAGGVERAAGAIERSLGDQRARRILLAGIGGVGIVFIVAISAIKPANDSVFSDNGGLVAAHNAVEASFKSPGTLAVLLPNVEFQWAYYFDPSPVKIESSDESSTGFQVARLKGTAVAIGTTDQDLNRAAGSKTHEIVVVNTVLDAGANVGGNRCWRATWQRSFQSYYVVTSYLRTDSSCSG